LLPRVLLLLVLAGCDSDNTTNDAAMTTSDMTQPCGPISCAGCCGVASGALTCFAGTDDDNCGSGGNNCIACSTSCVLQQCAADNADLSGMASGDLACTRSTAPAILGSCGAGCSAGYVCVSGACHKRCLLDCDCPTGTICQAGPSANACQ
jgi:hypothetical protein